MKIGIVEDELVIADSIREMLQSLGYDVLEPCSDYKEAVGMLHADNPDLLLLDIRLKKGKDGIEIAQYVRDNLNIPLIFISANSDAETVARTKAVKPEAYLVKPVKQHDLYTAIEIAVNNFKPGSRPGNAHKEAGNLVADAIFIKDGYYFFKVCFSDILFLSSENVYVTVHTHSRKYIVRTSLNDYLSKFDASKFMRVHQSYAVNINRVDKINSAYLLIGKEEIPVSKSYYKQLLASLKLG